MVLVDSSVWIEGLRRKGRLDIKVALEALLEAYEAQICAPVRLEVMGGAKKEERRKLETAEREFADYIESLRRAKDREEFERFMRDRNQRAEPRANA